MGIEKVIKMVIKIFTWFIKKSIVSRRGGNPEGVDETNLKVANRTPIATIGDQILIVLI